MSSADGLIKPFMDTVSFPVPLSSQDATRSLLLRLIWRPEDLKPTEIHALMWECDWEYFLRLAVKHAVSPLLRIPLAESALAKATPAHVLKSVEGHYATTLARNVYLLSETGALCHQLHRRGLPIMLLKGIALLEGVYPHPALRTMNDVDILVRRRDAADVCRLLSEWGYADAGIETPAGQLTYARITLSKKDAPPHLGRLLLEIHWDLFPHEYEWKGLRPPTAEFWQHAKQIQIGSHPALVPADEDHLCYLAMHNSIHCFDRLIGLVDVAYMWSKICEAESANLCASVAQRAKQYGARMDLFLNLALASALLGLRVPVALLEELSPPLWHVRLLAGLFTPEAIFDESFSSVRRYLTRALSLDRPLDGLRLLIKSIFPSRAWLTFREAKGYCKMSGRLSHFLLLAQHTVEAARRLRDVFQPHHRK